MYLTTMFESLHGNRGAFISSSIKELKENLIHHITNWDCDVSEETEEEITAILKKKIGFINEKSKGAIEVRIFEIKFGQLFEL